MNAIAMMHINTIALRIVGVGMLGTFCVTVIIIGVVMLLNKWFSK